MLETIFDFGAIIVADIVLSGDNALIIGMAAAGLAPELRKKAIMRLSSSSDSSRIATIIAEAATQDATIHSAPLTLSVIRSLVGEAEASLIGEFWGWSRVFEASGSKICRTRR